MQVLNISGKKVNVFAEHIDAMSMNQLTEALAHPAAVDAAVMPDIHAGYALPIGTVARSSGMVFPAWVGYDIGCGVSSATISADADEVHRHATDILDAIHEVLPVGFAHNAVPEPVHFQFNPAVKVGDRDCGMQLGTLGGGNHFAEVGVDADGRVWVTVHSGSRNVGHKLATYYMNEAANYAGSSTVEASNGIPACSELGRNYQRDVEAATQFAHMNRTLITRRVVRSIERVLGVPVSLGGGLNTSHNSIECDGELFVHRKGATPANWGMYGAIPGNMHDGVFIVRGKGNHESHYSASHGAGRVMSRSQARKLVDYIALEKQMSGIATRLTRDKADEAPEAYKDIFEVMRQQADLVEVLHHVKPIVVVKG